MGQPPNLLGSFDNHGDGTQNTNLGDGSQNNNNSSGQQTTISVGTGFVTAYIASNHQDEQFQNQGNIHDKIIRSLAFPQMRDRRDHIEPWYRNTCRWILEREECRSWREQPRGLLWIAGKPGSGKSTLMAFLHEKLCKSSDASQDLRLEFFFTARGTELQRTPLGMFRSLLVQILKSNATVCDDLRKAYLERCRDFGECDWEWPQVLLEKLLQDAICKLAALQQVTIFVDALDEAGETDARKLVNYFQGLNDAAKKSQARAKICISCRHYPSVAPFGVAEIVVDQHNHEDIATYIRSHLPSDILVTDGRHYEGWKDLMNQLTDQANGVFQWAHIVMPLIRGQIDDGRSPKDIRRWLRNVPADLESVYQYVLVHVIKPENRVQSLQFFQWVGLAERPLAVTEMRYAMAACHVDATRSYVQWQEVDNFITTDERMRRLIKALSGGLAEVVKGHESGDVVQVVHQTVNEFIRATGLALLSRVANPMITCIENCTIILQSQAMLYQSCLFCLATAEMPLANLQNTRDMEEVPSKNGPFLAYATVNLLIHAEKAGNFRSFALEWEVQILERMVGRWVKFYQLFDPVGVACPRNGTTILHMAAAANMTDVAAFAASNNGNVTVVDVRGNTPFHLAARCGHIEVGKIFLKMGAKLDTTCREGETALVNAASRGHVEFVEWLLEEGAAIDTTKGSSGGALQAASLEGKRNIVRILLDAKADVNAQGGRFGTALQAASSEGSTEVVKILLDAKADVNVQGGIYGNALQAASSGGSAELVNILLDAGAGINARGGFYGTALQAASWRGSAEIVNILLGAGADVNAQGGEYGTALQGAAVSYRGSAEVVKILLDARADVNAQGGRFGTALQAASYNGSAEVLRILLSARADVNAQGGLYGTALQAASSGGSAEVLKILLSVKAVVNAQGGEYGTALQATSNRDKAKVVKILLDAKADVNAQGGQYDIPLQAASNRDRAKVVKILLDAKADVNAQGGEYGTALQAASYNGSAEVVELLLGARADVNAQGGEYGTALQAASYNGSAEVVKILLDARADVNAQGGLYGTALQAASSGGSAEALKILLSAKAVVNAQGGEYGTALQAASNNASAEVVKMLLDAGADINAQGGQYGTAILAAVHKDFSFQIEILLRAGADPSLLDNLHRSPIHIAAAKGLLPILRQFPALSSAINSQDILSRTPLHLAVLHGHEDFALALLEMNADPLLRDEYGRNILDYAVEYPRLVARLHDFFPGIMQTDQLEQRARVQQSILQISNTMLCSISDPARPFLPLLHQLGHYLLFLGDADNAHSILSLNLDHGKLQIGANEDLICDTCYRDIHGMRIICRLCLGLNFCLSCNHKYPTHGRWNPHRVHDLVVVPYKQPPDLHHAMERLKDLLQHIARQYGGISELPPNTQPDFPTPRGPHPLATPLVFGLLATSLCTWHLLRRN